ncbi:hypothetical protein C7N83_04115 [Neisseria iguanae]|uniref:ISXO2-like transposase domain-containing protein n=1 Tax=Neisseria iguanae TaxID=90242 RepID=A0A2P7U1F2_9NEIS|nr:hypothetical protein C7N83_04115 [Neisseria iguanae]
MSPCIRAFLLENLLSDNASKAPLTKVIRGHISADGEIDTDDRKAYGGFVDMGYEKHCRVHHNADELARRKQHINGIRFFRSYVKEHLSKFHSISKDLCYLYLKEKECRFNHSHEHLG